MFRRPFNIEQFASAFWDHCGAHNFITTWCEMADPIPVSIAKTTAPADYIPPEVAESLAAILTRCKTSLIEAWLVRTNRIQ
jgi:hypothetical protein